MQSNMSYGMVPLVDTLVAVRNALKELLLAFDLLSQHTQTFYLRLLPLLVALDQVLKPPVVILGGDEALIGSRLTADRRLGEDEPNDGAKPTLADWVSVPPLERPTLTAAFDTGCASIAALEAIAGELAVATRLLLLACVILVACVFDTSFAIRWLSYNHYHHHHRRKGEDERATMTTYARSSSPAPAAAASRGFMPKISMGTASTMGSSRSYLSKMGSPLSGLGKRAKAVGAKVVGGDASDKVVSGVRACENGASPSRERVSPDQ